MYSRFFKVTEGPVLEQFLEDERQRCEAVTKILELRDELGATEALGRPDYLAGFRFPPESPPERKFWKFDRSRRLWSPKVSTKPGKAMRKRMDSLASPTETHCLKCVNLPATQFPVLISGNKGYHIVVAGSAKAKVVFIKVPWKDVDPEELDQYKADREKGVCRSAALDHLLWKPHETMVELKEWEWLRDIDEVNERYKDG